MPLHCNQGHENQTGSHFCVHCGEPLWPTVGHILEKRYRVVSQLGQGGFGRTYLVEDMHRFNERCVLKEFAPQVQGGELQKAKELFEREAGALYKLKHPQLPRFREFFQVKLEGGSRLFLAQDYVEGETYCELLKSAKQLSEVDVRQLICHLMPVLSYLHSQGVIHRDISPDNLILRRSDHLPVLIDFGGVKQVAAIVANSALSKVLTRLGKQGYAPEEQMQQGQVFPNSDLYALAVTALVLLTGKQPQELYDSYKGTWRWQREIKVSSQLETVLQKMLAHKPSDRYQSAAEVLQALQSQSILSLSKPNISQLPTVNLARRQPNLSVTHSNQQGNTQIISSITHAVWLRPWGVKVVGAGLIVLFATSAWAPMNSMLRSKQSPLAQRPSTSGGLVEKTRVDKIRARLKALKIKEASFNAKVDKLFYIKHPELRKRSLTTGAKDTAFREKWYKTAEELLANP